MPEDNHTLRVRYEYRQDPEARLQYTHGVWGGINTQGEIELNFYTESDKLPAFSEQVYSADGCFGHELIAHDDKEKVVTRNIHSRLLFSSHTAKALIEWLEEKIRLLDTDEELPPLAVSGKSNLQH